MWKLIISVIWDLGVDTTVGLIPGVEIIVDIIGMILAVWLWGITGVLAVWEVFDPIGFTDAPVPTVTIAGLLSLVIGGKQ